ncbi:MAG: tRNA (adenosine(37)-N6)-dimethylallyltransferase MiaA, partial [Bacteroidia bacterium]
MKPLLVIVAGPTAVGKTAVSIRLAKHFDTEILSADSRQFFREIPIGTAAPTAEEQAGVKHHFIGSHTITEAVDAGRFEREAMLVLDELFSRKKIVFVCGGSGLYIDALCNGFDALPLGNAEIRAALKKELETSGIETLQQELQASDPEYFAQVDQQNPARLIRALEIIRQSGKKYSELRSGKKVERPFQVLKIALDLDRVVLYERINQRVDAMVACGLEAEARAVLPYRNLNALRTVGYKECFDFFDGKTDWPTAVELIKQHSRNYAKRQGTWLRRDT